MNRTSAVHSASAPVPAIATRSSIERARRVDAQAREQFGPTLDLLETASVGCEVPDARRAVEARADEPRYGRFERDGRHRGRREKRASEPAGAKAEDALVEDLSKALRGPKA